MVSWESTGKPVHPMMRVLSCRAGTGGGGSFDGRRVVGQGTSGSIKGREGEQASDG